MRDPGTENYSVDGDPNNAARTDSSLYPWNRRRMVEDCVEILDHGINFRDFVDTDSLAAVECSHPWRAPIGDYSPPYYGEETTLPNGLVSGAILVPTGTLGAYGSPTVAPWFYPINTEDIDDQDDSFPTGESSFCRHRICLADAGGDGWQTTNGVQTLISKVDVKVDGDLVLDDLTFADGFGPVCFDFGAAVRSDHHGRILIHGNDERADQVFLLHHRRSR